MTDVTQVGTPKAARRPRRGYSACQAGTDGNSNPLPSEHYLAMQARSAANPDAAAVSAEVLKEQAGRHPIGAPNQQSGVSNRGSVIPGAGSRTSGNQKK